MIGGITFRQAIDNNKEKIIEFLSIVAINKKAFTSEICHEYKGEKEMPAVRKALNELRKEGKVTTNDRVIMWQGKEWSLTPHQ